MIVFSAIDNTQVKIGARSTIDIEANVAELQEVIVIGYGTVEKGDVTGVLLK